MPQIELREARLHYELAGPEGAPPLLLLHGLGSSARDWENQVPAFSARYRLIVPDLRGHGRSSNPAGRWSLAAMTADVAELLRALGVGPAHVVGLSMGGMVALQLAVDAPDRVRSLVVVNSGPDARPRSAAMWLAMVSRIAVVRLLGMKRLAEVIAPRLFPAPDQAHLRAQFVARWIDNDPRAYVTAVRAIMGFSVADRLAQIRCPTLVVTADQDYTPVEAKRAYVAQIAGARLAIIPDSRHATPLDRPEAFNTTVLDFLAALDAAAPRVAGA